MNPIFNKLAYWLAYLDTCVIEYPSALDALCFTATGDDDADDPREWTGVA